MKKIIRDIGLLILILGICAVSTILYSTNFGRGILFSGPRDPKIQVPVTYNLGWWTDQKAITIDSIKIDIVESKLSMFNSKTLISYKVTGQLTYEGHWRPVIEEVHISERINQDTTLPFDRIIEITPVVHDKEDKKSSGGSDKFEFKNEHIINSNHWGLNTIKFTCGQKEQTIVLRQTK
jgi:hypothetical protein